MRKTGIASDILMLYESAGLDTKTVCEKSKILLKSYRRICWATQCRAKKLSDDACFCGSDLSASLMYLSEFAPKPRRAQFERKVDTLFETDALVKLVDNAMCRVKEFYIHGDLYYEILSKSYLTNARYTTEELMEQLSIERTSFYDRKQEAMLIFGYALWARFVPQQ